jgi:hypothetical protein
MLFAGDVLGEEVRDRDREILIILDEYMGTLNQLDMVAHIGTYHFPHFRHAGGDIAIWNTPGDMFPYIDAPEVLQREKLRETYLGPDWESSKWIRRDIVQADSTKVHVATTFVRLRGDGSTIAAFDSLYVLTFESGRWAIKGRSSFAPKFSQ